MINDLFPQLARYTNNKYTQWVYSTHTHTLQPNNGMTLTLLQRVVLVLSIFPSSVFGWKMWRRSINVANVYIHPHQMHIVCYRWFSCMFVWALCFKSIENALFKCPSFSGWYVQWLLRRLYLSISFFPSFYFVLCSIENKRKTKKKEMWKFVGIQQQRHTHRNLETIKPLSGCLWRWLLGWWGGERWKWLTDVVLSTTS